MILSRHAMETIRGLGRPSSCCCSRESSNGPGTEPNKVIIIGSVQRTIEIAIRIFAASLRFACEHSLRSGWVDGRVADGGRMGAAGERRHAHRPIPGSGCRRTSPPPSAARLHPRTTLRRPRNLSHLIGSFFRTFLSCFCSFNSQLSTVNFFSAALESLH